MIVEIGMPNVRADASKSRGESLKSHPKKRASPEQAGSSCKSRKQRIQGGAEDSSCFRGRLVVLVTSLPVSC